jgi:hypothetical protein
MRKNRSPIIEAEAVPLDACPLCGRDLVPDTGSINEHHLIPRLRGGARGPTVMLHIVCHNAIHARFTETELARVYNTIEKLLEDDTIQKFVAWVSRKDPEFYDSSREGNDKKKKRRR